MCLFKNLRDLYYLPTGIFRTEINGSSYSRSSQIPGIPDSAEEDLLVFCWIGKKLVMIDLNQKRYLMRIFPGDDCKIAYCSCDSIASAFYSQLNNVLRIKIHRVRSEGCTGCMLNIL